MLRISTVKEHERMSTQSLLQILEKAVAEGETDFYINASGQHDIGGPLWNNEGKILNFTVTNPGQRVGSMCLAGTKIIVEGAAPADVGWLNSGGIISVRGDAGDTAGHCAAGGKIYIGGRAGTRTGSLMKHDPEHNPPELWILNSTGSFSFEFMSGGKAVVCGHNSQITNSVLGERPCVGMVGGVVYFRGPCADLPSDVISAPLDDEDILWLESGIDEFLENIGKAKLRRELTLWKHWRKLVPAVDGKKRNLPSMQAFHREKWISGGIFGDIFADDFITTPLVATGDSRLTYPFWDNTKNICIDCRLCLQACPQSAIKRRQIAIQNNESDKSIIYQENPNQCIGCGICATVCPKAVWRMEKQ